MNVEILHLQEGAKQARGITVIIDVFRAFSLQPYLFAQGCEQIYAVYDEKSARELKKEHPEYILCGERHGKILPGFDFGNSPSSIIGKDFTGMTVIHSTSNGTFGIANAKNADEIYVASLLNAKATCRLIASESPAFVSLVCMGWEGRKTEEDILCGEYMRSILLDEEMHDIRQKADALRYSEGKKFFDPLQNDIFPESDFALCTDVDRFDFAIKTNIVDGLALNRKVLL